MSFKNYQKSCLTKCFLIAISLVIPFVSLAQKEINVVTADQFTIKSKILNEDRVFSVFLPDDYRTSSNKYPVLYLLDGRTHFEHAVGATKYLAMRNLIPNLIVVSIHNVDRRRDFSPVKVERMPTSGGGAAFLKFLSVELKDYIKSNYRVSDFSILLGHSFGGTFAAYSLLERPNLFDGYLAVSPYLLYANNYMVDQTKEKFQTNFKDRKYFYMTVGDEPAYFEPLKEYSKILEEGQSDNFKFKYVKMESENHGTIPYLTLFNGLRFIFSDWTIPRELLSKDLDAIDAHFKMLSDRYDVKVKAPENVINMLGYEKLQSGNIAGAIELFQENVKRFPKSANVYDSLGEAYENDKQIDLARKNYKKACQLGAAGANPNLMIYLNNLERVGGKFK